MAVRIMSTRNSNDTIGIRTRDLPACSAVPQSTVSPRAPIQLRGYRYCRETQFHFLHTLNTEAVFSSETSVTTYQTRRSHDTEVQGGKTSNYELHHVFNSEPLEPLLVISQSDCLADVVPDLPGNLLSTHGPGCESSLVLSVSSALCSI